MKVIIAGSRHYNGDPYAMKAVVEQAIHESGFYDDITEVVCGMARGVDECGRQWAIQNNIPVKPFPADWMAHGKAAGPIRNRQMAEYSDALVALWDGTSKGTRSMIDEARKRNLRVYVHRI